jgi:hypothetical protein
MIKLLSFYKTSAFCVACQMGRHCGNCTCCKGTHHWTVVVDDYPFRLGLACPEAFLWAQILRDHLPGAGIKVLPWAGWRLN